MLRTPDYWTARLLDAHRRQGSACRDRGTWFYLLQADEPDLIAQALAGMRETLELRIADPGHPQHGHFWWTADQRDRGLKVDPNTLCFVAFAYLRCLLRYGAAIPADLQRDWRAALETGIGLSVSRDIHPGYTNIACLIPAWLTLAGLAFDRQDALDHAAQKVRTWWTYQQLGDAPREYASPAYLPLALISLAEIAARHPDPETRDLSLKGEQSIWRHAARHYHRRTRRLAGPHSRIYDQAARFPLLAVATGCDGEMGDPVAAGVGVYATAAYHPPDGLADLVLRRPCPQLLEERVEPWIALPRYELGAVRELVPRDGSRLRMVAHLAADAIRFRTSRTFLGESFTVGTISEALAGDQRNNYVLHVAVPPDRSDAVTDRILFDGRSFSHGEAHCWCWADQRNGSALLVRRLNRIAFSDPFPFSAGRADLDTPVQEASLEIRLPGWNRLEEAWAGDTALASGTAGPLGSTRFAFRVGTVWAGFRLAAAEAGWELAADEQGLILRHRFWQRDRKTAKTVALLAEAGEASPGAADFAAFRANLAAGRFDTAPGCFRFERDGLTLAVELEPFG